MKNNGGITLVALVVIIVLLIIFSSAAIYTAIDSFKIIDIQKYKAQMQLIQSAVDEFYEEYENSSERSGDTTLTIESYIANKSPTPNFTNIASDNEWWKNIAVDFNISTNNDEIRNQYYYLHKTDLETFLGVSDIDISENFIINFQKRYVFSETPLQVNNAEEIYCLYQLNEEEKVIEFKVNNNEFGRNLDVDIIDVKNDYQKIKIRMDNTQGETGLISESYFARVDLGDSFRFSGDEKESDIFTDITKDNAFGEISGINAKELTIKIKKEGQYIFKVVDSLGNKYYSEYENPIPIKFHEQPVLENNLIPFIPKKDNLGNQIENKGIVYPREGQDDINEWYNYANGRYATAVISNDEYEKNKGKTFDINQSDVYVLPDGTGAGTHIVKVWIPKKLARDILESNYDGTKFINKTGIWVTASWDDGDKIWIPDEGKFETEVESFSKTELNINLISTSNLKYYWKKNNESDYQELPGNTLTITATNNIKDEVKSISIYGRAVNGNTTKVQTVVLKEEDISNYNELEEFYNVQLNLTAGSSEITQSLNKNLKNKYINNNYYYVSAYAEKATESEGDRIEFYFPPVGEIDKLGYEYLQKNSNQFNKYGILKQITAGRTNDPLYLRVDYDNNSNKNINNTLYVERIILINTTKLQNDYKYVDLDNVEWCKCFIDMRTDGVNDKVIMYYYE